MLTHRYIRSRGPFAAAAGLVVAMLASSPAPAVPPLESQIASRDATDTLAGAIKGSISGDGRYVAFLANNGSGVLRRDRLTGDVLRIDQVGGVPGNAGSFHPSLSGDGFHVVFESLATNLGTGDANSNLDIYLALMPEVGGPSIERISVGSDDLDLPGVTSCFSPEINADGSYAVFTCQLADGTRVVYLREIDTRETTLVSTNLSSGISPGTHSHVPAISPNGNFVAFASNANDLVPGDSNGKMDAFVYDVFNGGIERVSVTSGNAQIVDGLNGVSSVDVTDGCHFAFDHDGNGIVPGDSDDGFDVFWGVCGSGASIVSVDDDGLSGSNDSRRPSIVAAPGAFFIAFESNDDLDTSSSDFTGGSDVFVREPFTSTTRRANVFDVEGLQFDTFAVGAKLSDDGRQLLYQAAGGSVTDQRIALRNPLAEVLPEEAVDVAAFGTADSLRASSSADGRVIVFESDSTGFDRGWFGTDDDGSRDIYVYDVAANCVEQASMGDGATNGGVCVPGRKRDVPRGSCAPPQICGQTLEPSIDSAGNMVVFVTDDASVAKYANETAAQRSKRRKGTGFAIALRNMVTGNTFRLATATTTGTGSQPRIAPSGGSAAFVSSAALTGADTNAQPDVYRLDLQADGSPGGGLQCLSCTDETGAPVAAGGSGEPTLSADGKTLAFTIPNGVGGRDILLRNLITGSAQRYGTGAAAASRQNAKPALDHTGKRLVFQSNAPLVVGDLDDGGDDIFVQDLVTGALTRVSGGDGVSRDPTISGDGKVVGFVTTSTDLDPDALGLDGEQYVHVRRLDDGIRTTLARNQRGGLIRGSSSRPALDYNGVNVVYDSAADNVLGEDTDFNDAQDVFRRSVPFNIDRVFENGFE